MVDGLTRGAIFPVLDQDNPVDCCKLQTGKSSHDPARSYKAKNYGQFSKQGYTEGTRYKVRVKCTPNSYFVPRTLEVTQLAQ